MRRWFSSFALECRHLFFNPVFLLLPLLFGIWFAFDLSAITPPRWEDIYHFAYDFHKVKHMLSLGIAMLIGIHAVRRDMINPSYEWLRSYPVSTITLLTAKFVSGFFYLTLFTLAMSVVYVRFALGRHLTVDEILSYLLFFGLQYEVSYAVTLALAMSLAIFFRGRIVYLIGFNAWMFGTFFIDLFIISRYAFYPLKTFHLNQFLLNSLLEHEVWGIPMMEREVWLSRFFVLSFILMLLAVVLAVYHHRIRPSVKSRRWIGYSVGAFLIAVVSFLPYGALWMERYASTTERIEASVSYDEARKLTAFPVEAYSIHLTVTPDQLSGEVTMQIPPEGMKGLKQIPFTLNHLFHVHKVAIDGDPVSFTQRGDLLTLESQISQGNKPIFIYMTYSGKIADWNSHGKETYFLYADDKSLYLPDRMAWYPKAGKRGIYVSEISGPSPFPALNPFPSHFTLSIQGMKNPVFSSLPRVKEKKETNEETNGDRITFTGDSRSLSLFSGTLTEVKLPGEKLTVVTSPGNRYEAEKFLRRLIPVKRYFEHWFGNHMDAIDTLFYFSPMFTDLEREELTTNAILVDESQYHNLDGDRLAKVLNGILFSDTDTNSYFSKGSSVEKDFSLVGEIRIAFYYLYARDALQLSHQETVRNMEMGQDEKERAFPSPVIRLKDQPQLKRMLEEIDGAIAAGKMESVKRILNHFHAQGLTIKRQDEQIEPNRDQTGIISRTIKDTGTSIHYPRITWEDWEKVWKEEMAK